MWLNVGAMSGDSNKARRRVEVDGVAVDAGGPAPRPAGIALGLDKELADYEGTPVDAEGRPVAAYDPRAIQAFVTGNITLGDLEGITKEEQYQVAQLGFTCLTTGKLDEAARIFEGLLALDPFDAYFNLALGSVAHQRGDLETAEVKYTRSLEINPYSASAYAHRGEIRIQTGRLGEGTEDLVKALDLDPRAEEPATHRARSTLSLLQEKLGSLDPAELEERAAAERAQLAETEEVVQEALHSARSAPDESEAAEGADEGTPSPSQILRRGRPSAKRPKA